MKKFLFGVLFALVALTFSACGTQFGITYGVHISGDGDGQFEVVFPQGSYAMDGKAALVLNVGDSILFNNAVVTTKNDVLLKGDKKELEVMQRVNDSIATQFSATAGSGTYDLWLKGFVKEIGTGLVFEIDRHITNRDQLLRKSTEDVFCPYIK